MNKTTLKNVYLWINSIRFIPIFLIFCFHKKRNLLKEERKVWIKVILNVDNDSLYNFLWLLTFAKEYRNVIYFRLGSIASGILPLFASGQKALCIRYPNQVGVGLVIQHGHSTRIGAAKIGKNCQIWHNVTVGANRSHSDNSRPFVGDNVKISTGAIIIGPITIGNNVTIAAGAVVTKNVPDNCIVAGNPAKIIKRDGVRVDEKL